MRRIRAMGIRDKPIAPASPWQNGFAERLIGSIRRECVDHFVVLGEEHVRRILQTSIGLQDAAHMLLAQDDKVVHTLAPDRSDQPFGKAILPRRGWRYRLVPDAHGANSAHDDGSNSWTIAQHRSPPLQAVTHVEFPTTWHPKQELSGLRSYAHLLFSR